LGKGASLVDGVFKHPAQGAKSVGRHRLAGGHRATDGFQQHGSAGEGLANVVVEFETDLAILVFERRDKVGKAADCVPRLLH
jgi:hypothetical protein